MRQIILDTETTGLSYKEGHRIIEIGCLELVNRRLTGRQFHRYTNPEREVEIGALNVHGITNEFLEDKPKFVEIADEFYEFVKSAEIVAHNAPFDIGFLNFELKLVNPQFDRLEDCCEIFDTLKLARKLHPGQRNNLDALCKRYKIESFNRDLHGALLDAEILTQVYLVMTGGQGSLFSEADDHQQTQAKRRSSKKLNLHHYDSTTVIKANEKELKAHEDFLQFLKEKSENK